MSRRYHMEITVKSLNPKQHAQAEELLCLDEEREKLSSGSFGNLIVEGETILGGGRTEEEFTQGIAEYIWEELGEFHEVVVVATYLENLPYETHTAEREDYERWKERQDD